MLGKALADLALHGQSKYALHKFSISRKDPNTGKGIIVDVSKDQHRTQSSFGTAQQASGSSLRGLHNTDA